MKKICFLLTLLFTITTSYGQEQEVSNKKTQNIISNKKLEATTDTIPFIPIQPIKLDFDYIKNSIWTNILNPNYVNINVDKEFIEVSNISNNFTYHEQFTGESQQYYNCGPSTLKTVLSGYIDTEDISYSDIREVSDNNTSLMYTNEIINCLDYFNIKYSEVYYMGVKTLINEINKGNPIILCVNMGEIEHIKTTNEPIGKNYSDLNRGHFIVLTGYKYENNELLFQTVDPANEKRSNGEYRYEEYNWLHSDCLDSAISEWYNYLTIVEGLSLFKLEEAE